MPAVAGGLGLLVGLGRALYDGLLGGGETVAGEEPAWRRSA